MRESSKVVKYVDMVRKYVHIFMKSCFTAEIIMIFPYVHDALIFDWLRVIIFTFIIKNS